METKLEGAQIDEQLIQTLIQEVESMNPSGLPMGNIRRHIQEDGFYEELGLYFDWDDIEVGQLYAGLAALARDMHGYLLEHPREDAALFEEVVAEVHQIDRTFYGDQAFPDYKGLLIDDLPVHLAEAAAIGQPVVAPLGDPRIIHEWTFKPGKRLLVKFLAKLKETICGKGGPYNQFKNGLLGKAELPASIVIGILTSGLSAATFWTPLAVYLSLLLIKLGLKVYCENGEVGGKKPKKR